MLEINTYIPDSTGILIYNTSILQNAYTLQNILYYTSAKLIKYYSSCQNECVILKC